MAFLLIMIDGIGIAPPGVADPVRSASGLLRTLHPHRPTRLPGNGWAVPTRADLDTPGLPQSATGHTTILTGINAARVLGRHFPGFPMATLRGIIERHSLLGRLADRGLRARYVNAFRPSLPAARKRRLRSACTIAAQSSGQRLRGISDILEGRALYHDFTNRTLIERGESLPLLPPREAGKILAGIAEELDFAMFEYFLTDLAGHAQDPGWARSEVRKIDAFLEGVLEHVDLRRTAVLVCSDHGNLEDLSVRTHTRNHVPTLFWGPEPASRLPAMKSIEHIAPWILHTIVPDLPA